MSRLEGDLSRFLILVPYVAAHPRGVPVRDVCERLDVDVKQLTRLLDRVVCVGAPDGTPDEMVELYLEGDRVHVTLPQKFVRPPRFSVEEMLALLMVLAPLRSAGPSVQGRADALSKRLTELASQRAENVAEDVASRVRVDPRGLENPAHLRDLERAIEESLEVDAEYFTASRDSFGARVVRPRALVSVRGVWYLLDDEAKRFRVERFHTLTVSDRVFEPASEVDLSLLRSAEFFENAALRLEARVDGEQREIPAASLHTTCMYATAARGQVEILGPADAREAVAKHASELLARYT